MVNTIPLVVAVVLLLAGQAMRVYPLLTLGRGSYSRALDRVLEGSPEPIVRVGSDHDFRNQMLVDFYAPLMRKGKSLRYIPRPRWREEPPDWFLTHSQELSYQPPRGIILKQVGSYRLVDEYRFAGISGWSWFLYRRE